ncbi:MAG: hypothetical protein ACHQ1E_16065, partial [Ktedonobacterales bacterium]
ALEAKATQLATPAAALGPAGERPAPYPAAPEDFQVTPEDAARVPTAPDADTPDDAAENVTPAGAPTDGAAAPNQSGA